MAWRMLQSLAVLGLTGAAMAGAQQTDSVWVNLRSRVYHCPGTEYYGRTARGQFLAESEARRRGFRPNGGRRCDTAPPVPVADSARPLVDPPAVPPASSLTECRVQRIVDGDGIVCEEQGSVRLIGIDSPERDQEPFGTAAAAGLASLIPEGAVVALEQDRDARDPYGRLLAYAWFEGIQVNWSMVRKGWAVAVLFPPNDRYYDHLKAAEERARVEGRGLWRVEGFACLPADHRRKAC